MNDEESLSARFHDEMLNLGHGEMEAFGYRPVRFLQMVAKQGGLSTAGKLLMQQDLSYGFQRLWEAGRLDLSMEALVLQEPWNTLFTERELMVARSRLEECGYVVE